MNKIFKVFYFFCTIACTISFWGCISDTQMESAKKVTLALGAEDYALEIEKSIDSKTGDTKILIFTMYNAPLKDNSKKVIDSVLFWSAKNFVYDIHDKKEFKGVEQIKITIDNGSAIYSKAFPFKELNR